jgi:hypothetical protein
MWNTLLIALVAIPMVASSAILKARQANVKEYCGCKISDDPLGSIRSQLSVPFSTDAIITIETVVHEVVNFGQDLPTSSSVTSTNSLTMEPFWINPPSEIITTRFERF